MLQSIVDKLAQSIASSANAAATVDRIGQAEPAAAVQLPRLVISVAIDDMRGTGFSRFARTGDVITQQTTVVQVAAGTNGFSSDLRSMRIARLPLRKNPSSVPGAFTAADISVANVSAATREPYGLVARPRGAAQFSLDERTATLSFGAVQTPGSKLELVHWTVQWHDDIATTRVRGRLLVDVWSNDPIQLDSISRKLTANLFDGPAVLREHGFAHLTLTTLDPIAGLTHQPAQGSPFAAWRQRIGCKFIFDHETGGAVSEGSPIERIDVQPAGFVREDMTVR